jgi:hypothetical protein
MFGQRVAFIESPAGGVGRAASLARAALLVVALREAEARAASDRDDRAAPDHPAVFRSRAVPESAPSASSSASGLMMKPAASFV